MPEEGEGRKTLDFLDASDTSPLGAVALHTGGIVVEGGLVRVLGAGCQRMKGSLRSWNTGGQRRPSGDFLVVAHDTVGGFFLLNGGVLPEAEEGECLYFSPDNLGLERLKVAYSGFIHFCCQGDIASFYSFAQWPGRDQEVTRLDLDQGLSFYPFLWTLEGKDPANSSRRAVPMSELWELAWDFRSQLNRAESS